MTVRLLFCCERCGARPDADTERTLLGQLRDRAFAEYLDAQPGGWLIWSGGGVFGAKRYACARHRDDLIADLHRHHGATHSAAVRKHGPYRALWPDGFSALDERELAELLARARHAAPAAPTYRDHAPERAAGARLRERGRQLRRP